MLPVPRKPRASGPPLKNAARWCRCQHQRETCNGVALGLPPMGRSRSRDRVLGTYGLNMAVPQHRVKPS